MEKQLQDLERCESDPSVCGIDSNYCFSCCGWGLCNYGTCKEQNGEWIYVYI